MSGSFTVTSSSASLTKTILSDQLTEGAESFTLQVRTVSTGGEIIGTININITDTSTFATSIKLFLDAANTSSYSGTGTTWTDLTGTANGTLVNSVKYTTGNTGLLNFDNFDDYITVPNNLTYTGTLGFSFSVWIMPFTSGEGATASTGNGGYGRILDKSAGASSSGAPTNGFSLRMNAAQDISFQIGAGAAITTTGNQVPYGTWTHLVISVTNTGVVNIYKNGNTTAIASGTTGAANAITTTNLLTIGNRSNVQDSTFDGNIPVVKFYTKAITSSEANSEYGLLSSRYTSPVPVTSGAILYADAKDYSGSGTTWSDTSGSANNLTLINSPVFSRLNAGYFTFNGTNQYANRSAFSATLTSATFLAWVYDNGLQPTGAGIITNRHAGDATAHGLNLFDSGAANSQNLGYHWNDTTYSWQYNSTIAIPDGQWCMVALAVSSTSARFYIYTTTTTPASNTQTLTSPNTNNTATFAGIDVARDALSWDSRYFNGRIGTAVLYNRALTLAEITQNYSAMRARFGV